MTNTKAAQKRQNVKLKKQNRAPLSTNERSFNEVAAKSKGEYLLELHQLWDSAS